MKPSVLVIGSMNMDLVVQSQRLPAPGETVLGHGFFQNPGGKGANQGVALAKLGARVHFLGKVGEDAYGEAVVRSMEEAGVSTDLIKREGETTGLAFIQVDAAGRNNIVVLPGANDLVDAAYLEASLETIRQADMVLLQLEIPTETVRKALQLARRFGKLTILNPAPARPLDEDLLALVDILIPNEHELELLSGVEGKSREALLAGAKSLLDKGVGKVVVTLGSRGVLFADREGHRFHQAYAVTPLDTTAAGDGFIGGFVASYLEDRDVTAAIQQGQKTAAIAIQRLGAQSSLPTAAELEQFTKDGRYVFTADH